MVLLGPEVFLGVHVCCERASAGYHLIEKASQSPYFALLCDGGTDSRVENHTMVYIRHLDILSFVTSFLCSVRVTADDASHHTAVLVGIKGLKGLKWANL